MYYTGTPEFPFGHGLSYSSWELAWHGGQPGPVRWTTRQAARDDSTMARFSVRVSNVGKRAGRQTVLLFWRPVGHHARLRQKLVAYSNLASVAPGADGVLDFAVTRDDLAIADHAGHVTVYPGQYELVVRDGSNELRHPIVVDGSPRIVRRFPGEAAL